MEVVWKVRWHMYCEVCTCIVRWYMYCEVVHVL